MEVEAQSERLWYLFVMAIRGRGFQEGFGAFVSPAFIRLVL